MSSSLSGALSLPTAADIDADVNVDAAAAADEFYDTLPSDPATLSQLFQWSIENSDLDALREMADGTKTGKPEATRVKIDDDKAESWVARAVRRFVARATSSMTSSSSNDVLEINPKGVLWQWF